MKRILLIVLGVVVAAAVVFVVVVVRGERSAVSAQPVVATSTGPSISATPPSVTPTAASTPRSTTPSGPGTPDAAGQTAPEFSAATSTQTVECAVPGEGPAGSTGDSPVVTLSWSSEGAGTAFVGVDTTDARAEPYSEVAVSGTISLPFACPAASHTYTITLVGPGGDTSRTFTVQNTGHTI